MLELNSPSLSVPTGLALDAYFRENTVAVASLTRRPIGRRVALLRTSIESASRPVLSPFPSSCVRDWVFGDTDRERRHISSVVGKGIKAY
jgi:hypothetical protein